VEIHATDFIGINGITRVLLVYTCQQIVYPRGHVLPLILPHLSLLRLNVINQREKNYKIFSEKSE
jgi:hypothetical protein